MADMDRPRGAYILGIRIPGEIYWLGGMAWSNGVVNLRVEPKCDMLIVSRGLFHPEPWAIGNSKLGDDRLDPDELLLVQKLLSYQPDVWITPVVAGHADMVCRASEP